MDEHQHIWRVWSRALHQWGVVDLAAVLLEACGPLTVVGAQAIYLGQPVLKGIAPDEHLGALATMLENTSETRAFVTFLREADPS